MPEKVTNSESPKTTQKAEEPDAPKTIEEHAELESLKMTKEWSIWLVALQSSICTLLWSVLKAQLDILRTALHFPQSLPLELKDIPVRTLKFQVVVLHLGWLWFAVSAVFATTLVCLLPFWIARLAKEPGERKGYNRLKRALIIAEYAFFLLGVIFILTFVFTRFLDAI